MTRNAMESDLRSSDMAAAGHFVNLKKSGVLILNG